MAPVNRNCSVAGCTRELRVNDRCLTSLTRRKSSIYVCIEHSVKNQGTDTESGFHDEHDIFGWFRWSFLWEMIVVFTITIMDYARSLLVFWSCTEFTMAPIIAFSLVVGSCLAV